MKVNEKRRAFTGKRRRKGEADAPRDSAIERFTRTGSIRPDGVSGRQGKGRVRGGMGPLFGKSRTESEVGGALWERGEGEERG